MSVARFPLAPMSTDIRVLTWVVLALPAALVMGASAAAPARGVLIAVTVLLLTYRAGVIRIFGAGYWRKGRQVYERENQIHGRTARKARGSS